MGNLCAFIRVSNGAGKYAVIKLQGRDQYAPGQRVRQRSRKRDRAAGADLRGRWREPARAVMILLSLHGLPPSQIAALLECHPATNRDIPRAQDGSLPDCWLLAQWAPAADEPTDYWLSNLPPHTPIAELVRLAKIRWRVEHDYRELKTGLGPDHFEGRSFAGWHRHVTLATLAQAFCTLLRPDPKAHAPR